MCRPACMRPLAVKCKTLCRRPLKKEVAREAEVAGRIESSLLGFSSTKAGWGGCTEHGSKLKRNRGGVAEASWLRRLRDDSGQPSYGRLTR